MDYDDNDFQSQNFQLAGEDNSKFPSSLRPFALPKFDIDEQLQGHLRFDNLIEAEVFFGVQGHDNNWIEGLSTGSSVVDFSSSAAESCSISRTNNVWSEATSTESVEMLLKSMGENEMSHNMDSNAHHQLNGVDGQMDPLSLQDKSSNSPMRNMLAPNESNDQSHSTPSRVTEDPSRSQPQVENIPPILMGEKAEQAVGSNFIGGKSNSMVESVTDKRMVDEKLPSASNNTAKSCVAVGNYFEVVHDDGCLDNLKAQVPLAEVDSRKLNNQSFSELSPLQNIYTADSYRLEQGKQESGVDVTPAGVHHVNEHKVEGDLSELRSLSHTGHSLDAKKIFGEVSNENLLSESSDGLLEAITNPVKMLHKKDDNCKGASVILQPSFSHVESTAEGLKSSADRSNDHAIKEVGVSEEAKFSGYHQPDLDSRISNPHLVTPASTEDSNLIRSLEEKQPVGAMEVLEETENAGVNDTDVGLDGSKLRVTEQHQASVDLLKIVVEERKDGKETITGAGNVPLPNSEQTMKRGDDDNAKCGIDASNDKLDSSGGVAPEDSSAAILDEKNMNISSINNEVIVVDATPAKEDEHGDHNLASISRPQECKEQVTSSDSSPTRETQDKLGTDVSAKDAGIHSVNHSVAYPQKCPSDTPSLQSVRHEDLALSSGALGVSSDMVIQRATEAPSIANDDLTAHLPDKTINQGADHTPSSISSKTRVDSFLLGSRSGDGSCTEPNCGSPTVISCSEPCPQDDGEGSNALPDRTIPGKTEDLKDLAASADAVQSSKKCSSSNVKPTLETSKETAKSGDDRSFSFDVGALQNLSAKAHPDWRPFPSSKSAQNTEAATENPQVGSSPESSLKKTSEDTKRTPIVDNERPSTVGSCKELLLEGQVAERQGSLSVDLPTTDGTKTKSAPSEQMPQRPTTPSCALAHQPFTDLQHVQLRAQIFVYGALIQGIPPAEAYMVSAFGEPVGGGKPAWEAVWRASVERFQNQKSPLIGLETPSSRIGSCTAEKASKDTAAKTAPASRTGGKFASSARSAVPLQSPTIDMSPLGSSALNLPRGTHLDFSQVLSPVFTYHSSQMRQPTSTVAPWFPRSPGPHPAPWLVPPQSLIFDSSTQLPAVPTTETTKVTPSKEISVSHAVSPGVCSPSQGPSVSTPLPIINDEKQKAPASTPKRGVMSQSQKSRKRKKASAGPEQQPVITGPPLKTDSASVALVTKHSSGFTLSAPSPSNIFGSGFVPSTAHLVSVPNHQIIGSKDAERRAVFSEQICSSIEQSKGQTESAAMLSVEALRHREGVWNQLSAKLRNLLPSEVEAKLTSAAAAAAAAVSVAKAAAEAAKMASEAAMQAKMMADEALSSSKSVNEAGNLDVYSHPASAASLTPTSTWKVKEKTHAPGTIISVAREVARRRVEEASAAAKRAENLDAILKAAELAAEAVCQAGTIIAMGDPLPFTLRELLEAGPDGYWKSDRVKNKKVMNTDNIPAMELLRVDGPDDFNKSGKKGGSKTKHRQGMQNAESSSSGKELLQLEGVHAGNAAEDAPNTIPLNDTRNDTALTGIVGGIEKGSLVEVLADEGDFGGAWFSAKVIDIKENSVYIGYNNRKEGPDHHTEWVSLEYEGDRAPRIRLAHPVSTKLEGNRKRRRDVTGNYSWAAGDHVDALIKDSWRVGVIAQHCEGDETKFVVQFPVGGDSLVVDAWNLRPSLVWKDGQWTEWCRTRERKNKSNKGDSPYEKRQRTCLLQAGIDVMPASGEAGGTSMGKNIDPTKQEVPKPLALSDGDMVFNVGKSMLEDKGGALELKRSGPQKGGSGVVFGVPRPGKKRKFMEVSKHYVADQGDKVTEGNTSVRFAKNSIPQVPRPRDSTSKVEQKGRRTGEMRPRGFKPAKSQNIVGNNAAEKNPLSTAVPNSGASESSFSFVTSTKTPLNSESYTLEKSNSSHDAEPRAEDVSISESHIQAAAGVTTLKKNLSTGDRAKRKFIPSVGNLNRSESKTSEIPGRENSDSVEPRRSNRRIQPTSRLLEGLQSSLIISKVPGEKGARSHHRSASSRGRAHG